MLNMAVSRGFAGACIFQIVFALTLIIFGYIYKDDCPADKYVPIHLIVIGGMFICLVPLLTLAAVQFQPRNGIIYVLILIYSIIVLLCLFTTVLYGTIRIWNVDLDLDNPKSEKHCNSLLYEGARGFLICIFIWCLMLISASFHQYSNRSTGNHEAASEKLLAHPSINQENSSPPNYYSNVETFYKSTSSPNHDENA